MNKERMSEEWPVTTEKECINPSTNPEIWY